MDRKDFNPTKSSQIRFQTSRHDMAFFINPWFLLFLNLFISLSPNALVIAGQLIPLLSFPIFIPHPKRFIHCRLGGTHLPGV